mgnify:CR=1 FL=1
MGHWISPEPNVYDGEFDSGAGFLAYNVYAYCANDPVSLIDYNGEFVISTLTMCVIAGAVLFGTIGGFAGNAYANIAPVALKEIGVEPLPRREHFGDDVLAEILAGIGIGALVGGAIGYVAAPTVVSATGIAGISVTANGISTLAALGTSFGKLGTLIANNG